MGEIVNIVKAIKDGEKDQFVLIVKRLEPLIKKYMRLLYKDEKEDTRSEMILAIWEAIINIEYVEEEGQVILYLCRALYNKYMELYKKSRKKHDYEANTENISEMNIEYIENQYADIITKKDMENVISVYQGIKKSIYYDMIIANISDSKIAEKYGVTRQYVNRLRKRISKDIADYFIN